MSGQEPIPVAEQVRPTTGVRSRPLVVLATLTAGHGAKHWLNQAFWVVLPLLKADLALSPVQAGLVITVRQVSAGVAAIPSGAFCDMHRRQWPLILACSILGVGLAYMLLGAAPAYLPMLVAVGLAGIATSVWHPPALAMLSQRFPGRRGLSVSVHSGGGSVGESLAPLVTGFVLLYLAWRQFLAVSLGPVAVVALAIWWSLLGAGGGPGARPGLREYGRGLRNVLTTRSLLVLLAVAAFRGMSHFGLLTFLGLYLKEDLGMSESGIGLHIALLTALGIGAAPVLGWLSDRVGRKPVLALGFLSTGVGVLLLALFGHGWQLTAIVAFLGIFLYTLQPIVIASALDSVKGLEATTVAVLFSVNNTFSGLSPLIAGVIVSAAGTNVAAFYFVAGLAFSGAVTVLLAPLRRPASA